MQKHVKYRVAEVIFVAVVFVFTIRQWIKASDAHELSHIIAVIVGLLFLIMYGAAVWVDLHALPRSLDFAAYFAAYFRPWWITIHKEFNTESQTIVVYAVHGFSNYRMDERHFDDEPSADRYMNELATSRNALFTKNPTIIHMGKM